MSDLCCCGHQRHSHVGFPLRCSVPRCRCRAYSWRDARENPVRGDVLGYSIVGISQRRVLKVSYGPRVSASRVVYVNDKGVRTSCGLGAWRSWAVGATTLKRGKGRVSRGR